jgi:hypothetical protein
MWKLGLRPRNSQKWDFRCSALLRESLSLKGIQYFLLEENSSSENRVKYFRAPTGEFVFSKCSIFPSRTEFSSAVYCRTGVNISVLRQEFCLEGCFINKIRHRNNACQSWESVFHKVQALSSSQSFFTETYGNVHFLLST